MNHIRSAFTKAATKLRRKDVSRRLFDAADGVVKAGPFKGLKMTGSGNTSAGTLGAKIFGLYEQEVIRELQGLLPCATLVNFGAADGHFPLGLLKAGLVDQAICFEMSAEGQREIAENATVNGLSDRVVIQGAVVGGVHDTLAALGVLPSQTLILCDIEGAEFEVLSDAFFAWAKGAQLVVELHDRLMGDGSLAPREALIARLPKDAQHRILKGQPKDWRDIAEIEALSDNDRQLICSDGRKVLGEWLIVTYPK